ARRRAARFHEPRIEPAQIGEAGRKPDGLDDVGRRGVDRRDVEIAERLEIRSVVNGADLDDAPDAMILWQILERLDVRLAIEIDADILGRDDHVDDALPSFDGIDDGTRRSARTRDPGGAITEPLHPELHEPRARWRARWASRRERKSCRTSRQASWRASRPRRRRRRARSARFAGRAFRRGAFVDPRSPRASTAAPIPRTPRGARRAAGR